MPLAPGTRLGPYEILAPLGAGGMGEVYKARDPRLARDVAIKLSSERFSDRFEREARAIAALNHPNICQIYDIGPNYLVMEFIDGAPLQGPLPADQALKYATQICDALDAAHKKGIVHRDLKPANILATGSGLKLLDFGLARLEEESAPAGEATQTMGLTAVGTILGTAAYMSPEQAEGHPVDARSDIFSFGAVLYELLTGRQAFRRDSMAATLASVLRDEPPPSDTSTEIQTVIARCLRKRPADRFQAAAELRAALLQAASSRTERPSLAVLPFANLSSDKDNEYFGDGLAEEILNALTQLPGLRVIARTSAFAFRGRENAISEIGEKLQVSSVLLGSVRRSGSRLRIVAQLVNVADESQIWSERYDREMRDIFDIQDEIAQAIVAQLKVKLGSKSTQTLVKRYTKNLEAHSLYLRGSFHLYRLIPKEVQWGREHLQQAVALDPQYAPAWVQLADSHIADAFFGTAAPVGHWAKAQAAAARALEADPQYAEAHAISGFLKAPTAYQWSEAFRGLDTALHLNPGLARAHFWRGNILIALGRFEEAIAETQRAVDLDPLALIFRFRLAWYSLFLRQIDRAIEQAQFIVESDPNFLFSELILGEAYSLLGRHEEGIAKLEKFKDSVPTGFMPLLAFAYLRAGRRPDAERYWEELKETRSRQYLLPSALVLVATALGDLDSAFTLAEECINERDPNLNLITHSPYLTPLRSDPRFTNLLRRMNLQP